MCTKLTLKRTNGYNEGITDHWWGIFEAPSADPVFADQSAGNNDAVHRGPTLKFMGNDFFNTYLQYVRYYNLSEIARCM